MGPICSQYGNTFSRVPAEYDLTYDPNQSLLQPVSADWTMNRYLTSISPLASLRLSTDFKKGIKLIRLLAFGDFNQETQREIPGGTVKSPKSALLAHVHNTLRKGGVSDKAE